MSFNKLNVSGQISFKDGLDQLVQATGGRFQYEFPPDNNQPWKDKFGFMHASPIPRAGAGPAPQGLQLDLTANSGSVREGVKTPSHGKCP